MQSIVCIFGATSSGKSSLSVALSRRRSGEVVSADSMQVYRGMDIGTGKITAEERQGIAHHLLDIAAPDEHFSAGRFQREADQAISEILQRGNLPVVAGGTGLYFRALLRGIDPPAGSDRQVRRRLARRQRERGSEHMHRLLSRLDATAAQRLPKGDTQRILRALEYRLVTGNRLSSDTGNDIFTGSERYQAVKLGLEVPRPVLRQRIEKRVDQMLNAGWVKEVELLLQQGLSRNSHALQAIGYRQIVDYLHRKKTLEETRDSIVVATRQYAKRQVTWFRKEPGIIWLPPDSLEAITDRAIQYIDQHYKNL